LASSGHDIVDAPSGVPSLEASWRFPFPHPPLPWVKTLTLRGGGGGSTSFPFSKAQSGAAWVVDEFLAVGGCVWQCFLSGDEPGLEVVGKAPIRW
jgi:hypothetical protein